MKRIRINMSLLSNHEHEPECNIRLLNSTAKENENHS